MALQKIVAGFCVCVSVIVAIGSPYGKGGEIESSNRNFWTPSSPPGSTYTIRCRVDTSQGMLAGSETIRLTNPTTRSMYRLALDWSENSRQTVAISVSGTPISLLSDSAQSTSTPPIMFDLPEPLAGGKSVDLTIAFSEALPQLAGQANVLLTTWYPRLWWGVKTQDDFDVNLDVPSTYALATSGRYDPSTRSFHAEHVVTFGLFLGKGMMAAEAMAGDVLVRCVYSPPAESCAQLILQTAVDAINYYRGRWGMYPYKSLSIVPGYDRPVGGYNAATSISVIHGEEHMAEKPKIHWQWITAHEIGHMYWGEYVMEKDSPGWLWIGLGIYGDREYIRSRGLSPQMHRELMARYVKGVRDHVNTTVAITPDQWYDLDFDFNNIVTHGKGFSIISALANYLGKRTFDRIYVRCLKEFGGRRLGAAEFQSVCEAESGEDLNWFFDAWVRSNQYLAYQVKSQECVQEGDAYRSTIVVERVGTMKMPVPVVSSFGDGTTQQVFTERQSDENILHLVSKAPLRMVQIDPDSDLAMVVPPPELTSPELMKRISRLPWSGAGKEALEVFTKAEELKPKDEETWFKLGMILYDGGYYEQALDAFTRTAVISGDSSLTRFGALVWQGHVLDILGKRDEAIRQYRSALLISEGQEMHHGQYNMVINRAWVEERLKNPFRRK